MAMMMMTTLGGKLFFSNFVYITFCFVIGVLLLERVECVLTKETMYCHDDIDKCFFQVTDDVIGQKTDFATGESWCQSYGGNIASILSEDEARHLAFDVVVSMGVSGNHFIGLNDIATEALLEWSDGSGAVSYTNWESGQPLHRANKDCVQRAPGDGSYVGDWKVQSCTRTRVIICSTGPDPWQKHPSERCFQSSWTEYKCFYHVSDSVYGPTHNAAQSAVMCTTLNENGTLAVVESLVDQTELAIFADSIQTTYGYWLGLTDVVDEGVPVWPPLSKALGDYTNWDGTAPGNSGGLDCVIMVHDAAGDGGFVWQWVDCVEVAGGAYAPMCSYTYQTGNTPAPTPIPGTENVAKRAVYCHPELDKCFFQVYDTVDGDTTEYVQADLWCNAFGGHLASILSEDEAVHLASDVFNGMQISGKSHWIGLNDMTTEGALEWTESVADPVTYTNWEPGQPANSNKNDCVQRNAGADGALAADWQITSCTRNRRVVCSRTPSLWQLVGNARCFAVNLTATKCYYSVTDSEYGPRHKAEQAGLMCNGFYGGGSLATVYSADEQAHLAAFAASIGEETGHGFWLGLTDLETEGLPEWPPPDSTLFVSSSSYSKWYVGTSPNADYLDCVFFGPSTGYDWQWVSCLSKMNVMCSYDFAYNHTVGVRGPTTTTTTTPTAPLTTATTTTTPQPAAGPPPLFERCFPLLIEGVEHEKCFFIPVGHANLTWHGAVEACTQTSHGEAGVLMSLNSSYEYSQLLLFFSENVSSSVTVAAEYGEYWIGLSDELIPFDFTWLDLLPHPIPYSRWDDGYPFHSLGCDFVYAVKNAPAAQQQQQHVWRNGECSYQEYTRRAALCSRYIGYDATTTHSHDLPVHSHDFFGVGLFIYDELNNPDTLDQMLFYLADVANQEWSQDTAYDFDTGVPHQHDAVPHDHDNNAYGGHHTDP
eukprot:1300475-Rhodomonas_salina.3